MAHNLDMSNGRANIAFLGSRKDVWHRLGTEMLPGQSLDVWATNAGLAWEAKKVPAIANLAGPDWDHIDASKRFQRVDDRFFIVRTDTAAVLSESVSEQYQIVQPRDVLEWFAEYISVDSRFELDVAGSLKGGQIIWATAKFCGGDLPVLNDSHSARLLMATSLDGTMATVNQATMTRVVCNNTLDASLYDKRAMVRTSHRTEFKKEKVGRELARIASGFESYRTMAEAMHGVAMPEASIFDTFKTLLSIPLDAKEDDISTRAKNNLGSLCEAYASTLREGVDPNTGWAVLNAVTRYVDNSRATKGDDKGESRFYSANFGSGASMKQEAINLILPDWAKLANDNRVLVAA